MRQRSDILRTTFPRLPIRVVGALLVLGWACWGCNNVHPTSSDGQAVSQPQKQAAPPPPEAAPAAPATAAVRPVAALRAEVDPNTGEFIIPEEVRIHREDDFAIQSTITSSDAGLVETPSPVAGGGIEVDLKGRFQNPLLATIDSNGQPRITHTHAPIQQPTTD